MVLTLVPFRTPEILRIFWMGYITMYLAHMVNPRRLVLCIIILAGTVQFFYAIALCENVPLLARQYWFPTHRSVLHFFLV